MTDDFERMSAFPFNAQSGNTTAERLVRDWHARRILGKTDKATHPLPPADWVHQLEESMTTPTDDEITQMGLWLRRYRGEDVDFPFPEWSGPLLKKAAEEIRALVDQLSAMKADNRNLQERFDRLWEEYTAQRAECDRLRTERDTLKDAILRQAERTSYEGVFRD